MGVTPARWIGLGWDIFKLDPGSFVLITLVAMALTMVGSFVVAGPLLAGMFIAARRRMLEGRAELSDLFAGFSLFVDALLVYLLTTVFELAGLLLCVLPIFIVAALYLFPYLFLIDRRLAFWEAMEASRKLVMQDVLGYVLFLVCLVLLNIVGFVFAGVGLLVTIPVSVAAVTVAYQERVGFTQPPVATGPVVI